jgi:hypothetical protein
MMFKAFSSCMNESEDHQLHEEGKNWLCSRSSCDDEEWTQKVLTLTPKRA